MDNVETMLTQGSMHKTKATGEDIEKVINAMEPALEGRPRAHVLIACLTLATLIMDEDVTPEQLQDCVSGASEYICMYLGGREKNGEVRKELLN